MRIFAYSVCLTLLAGSAYAQTADSPPRFLAADVHPSRLGGFPLLNGPFTSAGLYKIRFATMVDLIHLAYGVEAGRVLGGPNWLEFERFDVVAKPPAGTMPDALPRMLQMLLAERFHLVAREIMRPMRISALRTASHLQMKRSDGSVTGCGYRAPNPRPTPGTMTLRCGNLTMPELAEQIRNIGRQGRFWSPLPVVDQTGLTGGWDFDLQYDVQLTPFEDNGYLSQNLEKQVGLKLEDIRIPAPAVEVASVDPAPTPDPPDLAQFIPPAPTEFDVAEIKPADPTYRPFEFKNGRVFMPQTTVANLIAQGWGASESEIVGLPKWAQSDHVDLIAKAPPEISWENSHIVAQVQPVDMEPLMPMIRSLLVSRYKLKVHFEDRAQPAYALLAVKPNLQKADPTVRATCHDGPLTDAADSKPNTALGRLVSCQNVTMAQFAELLPLFGTGVGGVVFDSTGLTGAWQFSLAFSTVRATNASSTANSGEASEPAGIHSIFDAVGKLGLKLESQKHPRPTLIIDHIEP